MRLAEKYDIQAVQRHIKQCIQGGWPQSLYQWDQHIEGIKRYGSERALAQEVEYPDDVYPEPVVAINFALEFDLPDILPAAYYHLYTIGPMQDWTECRKPDQLWDIDYARRSMTNGKRTARWPLLSQQGYHIFVRGCAQLESAMDDFVHDPAVWDADENPLCCDSTCSKRLKQHRHREKNHLIENPSNRIETHSGTSKPNQVCYSIGGFDNIIFLFPIFAKLRTLA